MAVEFKDNRQQVLGALHDAAVRALERIGLQAEGYAKDLCPVDTGNLRNSISHRVDDDELAVYVGSDSEYAAYVELGTGRYYAGGRPTPWVYQDEKGDWHYTRGNPAQPYLVPALRDHSGTYNNIIDEELKNG